MTSSSDQLSLELIRLRITLATMGLSLLLLGGWLWVVQVRDAPRHSKSLVRQSVRRVRIPATRGAILDRHGVCLAENRPSYCVAIYVEELRKPGSWSNTINEVEGVIDRLSAILRQDREVTREDIRAHIKRRLPLPFVAWRDLDDAAVARWAECRETLPGVDILVEPVRHYPRETFAAHAIGYVGKADPPKPDTEEPELAEERVHYYLAEWKGKTGIERLANATLCGEAGAYLIQVDASGYMHSKFGQKDPIPGSDVMLTLDARIQELAQKALAGSTGAVVVLDCRNGDVLAMASEPSFNPNDFTPVMSATAYHGLISDSGTPLLNRATSGIYAPGSTFKPIVAIAALEGGRVTPATPFHCPGHFQLGGMTFRCWLKDGGHGLLEMRKGIEQSCNVYFFNLGLATGYERILPVAAGLGLGKPTGVELGEEAGHLPRKPRAVRGGALCNISIGQGELATTPIQMASVTASIANGGSVYRPRLLYRRGAAGELVNRMAWSAETLRVVRGGMRDVIETETGTGKRARVAGFPMAGKTGTAEYGPPAARRKHTWMIAFAPAEDPRYAAAIVLDDGVSGGLSVAPLMRGMMEGIAIMNRVPPPAVARLDGGTP